MIMLPWPPAKLSPNARSHWAVKAKAARTYKMICFAMLSQYRSGLAGKENFTLQFCPPDSRRRDLDNMLASFKAGLDVLSKVTGVDDSKFTLAIQKGKPVKGGAVMVVV
jgi:crossover junction endodeoxyribonuclease RusA